MGQRSKVIPLHDTTTTTTTTTYTTNTRETTTLTTKASVENAVADDVAAESMSTGAKSHGATTYNADGETLTFYLGFKLDGIDTYRYTDESSPGWSSIDIRIMPEITRFSEVLNFDPGKKSNIAIQVCIDPSYLNQTLTLFSVIYYSKS